MTTAAVSAQHFGAATFRGAQSGLIHRAWTVTSWALTLAAVVLVLGAAAFFTVPQFMGWKGIIVLSGSMEPTLPVGGLVYIDSKVQPEDVEVGDIITFTGLPGFGGSNITHRVTAVTSDGEGGLAWQTQGDCCDSPDPVLIPASNLVGRTVLDVPHVGTASQWMQQRENFYLVVWLPAGIIIAFELLSIAREAGRMLRDRTRRAAERP